MAQRILEPGQIETLAQRAIPRFRIAGGDAIFGKRAARLRTLATASTIGPYLEFLAQVVEAQLRVLQQTVPAALDPVLLEQAALHAMPPIGPDRWLHGAEWQDTLRLLCATLAQQHELPPAVREVLVRLRTVGAAWIETQARCLLEAEGDIDAAAAPLIMAAMQVHAVALASRFAVLQITSLDVPGVCPLCGSLPVASMVYATTPYQGYRYLHCALCATEWHVVRVQCTYCGTAGKDIALQTLQRVDDEAQGGRSESAIRAETCEQCRGYRKIFYEEWDPKVEPVADDLASLALDMLVNEQGYQRSGGNPLLWLGRSS